jgi:hypothetical protein
VGSIRSLAIIHSRAIRRSDSDVGRTQSVRRIASLVRLLIPSLCPRFALVPFRTVHVVNLDPAAEHFEYPVAIDIRDLISLADVIEELNYGPNGGLIYCMESVAD